MKIILYKSNLYFIGQVAFERPDLVSCSLFVGLCPAQGLPMRKPRPTTLPMWGQLAYLLMQLLDLYGQLAYLWLQLLHLYEQLLYLYGQLAYLWLQLLYLYEQLTYLWLQLLYLPIEVLKSK